MLKKDSTLIGILGSLMNTDPDTVVFSETTIRLLRKHGFTEDDAT